MLKICTKCKSELSIDYFHKNKRSKDGLSPSCKKCRYEVNKLYAIRNSERISENRKIYNESNKEHIAEIGVIWRQNNSRKEYQKEYTTQNREILKLKRILYVFNNKEIIAKRKRAYVNANKELIALKYKIYSSTRKSKIASNGKQWRVNNKEKILIRNHERRSQIKQFTSTLTPEQWVEIKKIFNNKCAYCNEERKLTIEHFIPVVKYGELTINNIIPVCSSCNSSKGARDFFTWFPNQGFYSKRRESKILKHLGYNKETKIQQLALM